MNDNTGLAEAVNLLMERGKFVGQPQTPPVAFVGDPFIVLPDGMKAQSLAFLLPPTRIKQGVVLLEAGSFADYVNRYKTERTLIFANVTEKSATLKAVLDYHGAAPDLKPERCEHVATFSTIETPEWKAWLGANRQPMDQVHFATWLEDNLKLFVAPAGAELLELVRTLHGHANARFNTSLRLDNGGFSAAYEEDVSIKGNITTRSETMELPATVKAGIAPFQGVSLYEVTARLKSRVSERKLVLWFETVAVHEIVRDAVLGVTKLVAEKTGIVPLLGSPS